MLNKRELGGLAIWMASYDAENKITKAMFNSLYGEGYAFPEKELLYNLISISAKIKATEDGYSIRIQTNGKRDETNPALKYAELFMHCMVNLKIYIVKRSGAEFSEGEGSGTVINKFGEVIVYPSSYPEYRIIWPKFLVIHLM